MDNKKKIVLALGLILILALVAMIIWEIKSEVKNTPAPIIDNPFLPNSNQVTATATVRDWEETDVRKATPAGAVVPEMNTVVPDNFKDQIAVPEANVPVNDGTSAQLRIFNIKADGGKFIPEKIIVNLNDTVHINFTAADKDYDFTLKGYNMRQSARQGETKSLEFQALADGDFLYYCTACGGLESGPQGHIIVVK